MTYRGTSIRAILAALFTAGALAAGAVLGAQAATGDDSAPPAALVIDSSLASHGRQLVDPRLDGLDAEVRLPRDRDEARTNVRYFDSLGYRVYVAGPRAAAAAAQTGVEATDVDGLGGALAAVR
jgi:hypothetical protein